MSPTSYQTALPRVGLHILQLGVTRHHGQERSALLEAKRPLHLQAHAGIEDQHLLFELLQP